MRVLFQARPVDLYVVQAYAVAVSIWVILSGEPNLLALALVFVLPGYLAMACLLPRADQGDWALRTGLSLGLSFALVAFLGLALNFTPWGITFTSATLTTLGFSAGLGLLAYRRRMAVPPEERMGVALDVRAPRWKEYSRLEKGLAFLLAATLAVVVPSLALSLTTPRPAASYTDLYLLGPTGNFTGYPSVLNASQPGTLVVVVTNHEGGPVDYELRVDLVGVQSQYNATSGGNESVVVNRTTWSWSNFTLARGDTWSTPYTFSIPEAGTWWVVFDLFRNGEVTAPYRSVHLEVLVP